MKRPYRKNREDLIRFGSDLNKFVHDKCPPDVDFMNIDLLRYRAANKAYAIFESKHNYEVLTPAERKIFNMWACQLKIMTPTEEIPVEIFVVYADPPYRGPIRIHDIKRKKWYRTDTTKLKDMKRFALWMSGHVSTQDYFGAQYYA